MGLDSFWVHPTATKDDPDPVPHPQFTPQLRLCGGMLSDNGSGSFRGKVYDQFLRAATGVSLYQETIPNAVIRKMSTALNSYVSDDPEDNDVIRMFDAYARAGFDLHGWW